MHVATLDSHFLRDGWSDRVPISWYWMFCISIPIKTTCYNQLLIILQKRWSDWTKQFHRNIIDHGNCFYWWFPSLPAVWQGYMHHLPLEWWCLCWSLSSSSLSIDFGVQAPAESKLTQSLSGSVFAAKWVSDTAYLKCRTAPTWLGSTSGNSTVTITTPRIPSSHRWFSTQSAVLLNWRMQRLQSGRSASGDQEVCQLRLRRLDGTSSNVNNHHVCSILTLNLSVETCR